MAPIGIIILAAGGSTRMGRPKQLLRIGDQSMVRRAAMAAVDSRLTPAVIVLGANVETIRPELGGLAVDIVVNERWERGIGSSIRTGMCELAKSSSEAEGVCLMLADQPLVTAAILRDLCDAYLRSGKSVSVSAFGDSFGPPVFVGRDHFPRLLALADAQGAKSIWNDCGDDIHFEPCPEAAADLDTPEDCERFGVSPAREPREKPADFHRR